MARVTRTHRETVRLDFNEAERLNPSEERTSSDSGEEIAETLNEAGTS